MHGCAIAASSLLSALAPAKAEVLPHDLHPIATATAPALSSAGSGAGQLTTTVHVGDGTLDGSFLEPYNNAWMYNAKTADGTLHPQGIWTDHMQWSVLDGKRVMLRVQGTTFLNGSANTIVNFFEPRTLAPIKSETHGVDGTVFRRTFDGAHVTSVTLAGAGDKNDPDAADLPQAVYDFNGGMYGILLASLPLRKGLKGTLPAIADRDATLMAEPFEVLGRETVHAGARGNLSAWVVESTRPGEYTMTFWLSRSAPYIIRLVMNDVANHRVLTWDML
ncbi:DUF3108 domain-containing protein [Sphingomonas sp. URHD0057]|uniref:DUF3108 domain-containing protein n=1 Tax=Sphingomonas sp. URHD0057 TaxID=1380389 RepID=UPI0012DF0B8E|nr:DUF3108 domain-containing protein [Sphingomonas sp. URHD0057]